MLIARWAVKTAMIIGSTNRHNRSLFYTKTEHEQFRLTATIPANTGIWLGQYCKSSQSADGTDFAIPGTIDRATVSTIIVGHLALQVLTVRSYESDKIGKRTIALNQGQWDKLLTSIWPTNELVTHWPPPLTFTNDGKTSVGTLFYRWRFVAKQ